MDFLNAQTSYAVANAPLYLLERLRSDPDVQAVAATTAPKSIYKKIGSSLRKRPRTLRDLAMPYVYLVALGMTQDLALLRKASLLPTDAKWFRYLAEILMLETTPTTAVTRLSQSKRLKQPRISSRSSAPAVKIELG